MAKMKVCALAALCLITSAATLSLWTNQGEAQMINPKPRASMSEPADMSHAYAGMWKTADGHIRHELLPNGRYDEARGSRESAYQGRYEIRGTYIYYWDDTGFTADGDFIDGVLHHAGMILYREP
jgi:hypothetical protein